MRGTQDRANQEAQSLIERIKTLEAGLEAAIDARVSAETLADQERRAAADARLSAEPRIQAWKAIESEVDDVEFDDEDD
jgi:hypothetical protein